MLDDGDLIKTPLFQTNFFPFLIHVNVLPLYIFEPPKVLQIEPAFGGDAE